MQMATVQKVLPSMNVTHHYATNSDHHLAKSILRMAWGTAIGAVIGLFIQILTPPSSRLLLEILGIGLSKNTLAYLVIMALGISGLTVISRFLENGNIPRASLAYVTMMLGIAFFAYVPNQLNSSILFVFSLPTVAAGVLLDKRGLFITLVIIAVFLVGLAILSELGLLDEIATGKLSVLESVGYGIIILVVNGIMLDLFSSRQRLLEETEAAREAAETANRVKSQFLAAMSHELRTPLNAILNFTQFVSSGMVGPVNEEQVELLTKTLDSGKHLLALINDVLDISKIEAGAFKLFVEEDVNVKEEAEAAIAAGKILVANKPVEIIQNLQPDLPAMIGDKRRIRQIMLNIVSNACKFTEQGHITVSLTRQDDQIVFAVSDTGPGIVPEDHELIFESFRQTREGLRHGEGTGLGLPISRKLVEAHEGRLWLKSMPGEGSTFYVSFPIRAQNLVPLVKVKRDVPHVH